MSVNTPRLSFATRLTLTMAALLLGYAGLVALLSRQVAHEHEQEALQRLSHAPPALCQMQAFTLRGPRARRRGGPLRTQGDEITAIAGAFQGMTQRIEQHAHAHREMMASVAQ